MSDGGDCRTAPATPGLLIMTVFSYNDVIINDFEGKRQNKSLEEKNAWLLSP